MALEVTLYRADEDYEDVLKELMGTADSAIRVDCADPRANFVQVGWFMFPKYSLTPAQDVNLAA